MAGVAESRERTAGVLRLNLSKAAADVLVMPHLVDFLDAYPDITLEMQCDNALVDLVSGGFDAGIRLGKNWHKTWWPCLWAVTSDLPWWPRRVTCTVASSHVRRQTLPITAASTGVLEA